MHKVFVATLLLFPALAFGAEFSSHALFLSKTPVTEGEVVLIHAVIANEKQEAFEGELRFKAGDASIGAVPTVLKAGEARTTSISWAPAGGVHTVVAELVAKNGEIAASEEASFKIASKPEPVVAGTTTTKTDVESSAEIQGMIGGVSPAVADVSAPVFNTVDSWRQRGAEFLDAQIASTEVRLPQGGVLGAESGGASDPMGSAMNIFHTLYFYLLTLLRYILASAAIFYPLVAIGFLYFLWRLYRRMSAR